jgi:hypothetical protein
MTYLIEKDNSRILYVSKSTGNNQSALKGYTSRSWKDPHTAWLAAETGDIIHVLDGTWTVGLAEASPDIIHTGAGTDFLLKDNVNWYWEQNTGLTSVNDAVTVSPYLFSKRVAGNLSTKILGHGKFIAANSSLFEKQDGDITDMVDVVFNADTITFGPLGFLFRAAENVNAIIKVNQVNAIESSLETWGLAFFYVGDSGTNVVQSGNIAIEIGNYFVDERGANVAKDLRGIANLRSCENLKVTANVGNFYGYSSGNSVVAGFNSYGRYFNNSSINVNIGTFDVQHPGIELGNFTDFVLDDTTEVNNADAVSANKLSNLGFIYQQNGTASGGNSAINININTLRGTISAGIFTALIDNGGFISRNCVNSINVNNAYTTNNCPVAAVTAYGSAGNHKSMINVNHGVAETGPVVWTTQLITNQSTIVSGNFYTKEAAQSVIRLQDTPGNQDLGLTVQNAKLINDGTVAAIANDDIDEANDVIINNVATNVLIGNADPNVNPVGGTILRDANFK